MVASWWLKGPLLHRAPDLVVGDGAEANRALRADITLVAAAAEARVVTLRRLKRVLPIAPQELR